MTTGKEDTNGEDGDLMLAYAAGDTAAFEQLYARHKQALYRFMKNGCRHEALAHELYQDVWLRVIKSRESYHRQAPFNAWLFRIARNRLIDHYRQQPDLADSEFTNAETPSQLSPVVAIPLTPDEIASLSERAGVLHQALLTLPVAQREAMLLRHIAGMSVKEIASVVDEGVETIKSRLRYATARLRSQLQELL